VVGGEDVFPDEIEFRMMMLGGYRMTDAHEKPRPDLTLM
jgi:hypothetical protein